MGNREMGMRCHKTFRCGTPVALVLVLLLTVPCARAADFPFGLLLVGARDDHGWSQVCHEAALEIQRTMPGMRPLVVDRVNPVDRPGVDLQLLVTSLLDQGARVVIGNSDDMRLGLLDAARRHPQAYFIHLSGDDARSSGAPENLANLMGRMEFAKMMSGFVAALTSQTGAIGYVGPLINSETRRLASAAYLGARYAWTRIRQRPAEELRFSVQWIGFWFYVPDISRDPRQVSEALLLQGHDVLISAIDTPEPLLAVAESRRQGRPAWALAYDSRDACTAAPEVCLGTAYYNWYPGFRQLLTAARDGSWRRQFLWLGPDWRDITSSSASAVGFLPGPALAAPHEQQLRRFIGDLAKGSLNLFSGPLRLQNGENFLAAGEVASDEQIWRLPQLLEGMTGVSE